MSNSQPRLIPNSTQIPNFVIDKLMPTVSNACFVVLIFICRKTFGWGKVEDRISLTQIVRGTGISRPWVVKTLATLCESGLLLKRRSEKGDVYRLNLECDAEKAIEQLSQLTRVTQLTGKPSLPLPVNSVSKTGELGLPTKLNTKETIKTKQTVSDGASDGSLLPESSKRFPNLETASLREVWAYYLQKTGRREPTYSLTNMRKCKGLARLHECLARTGGDHAKAVELMKLAIDAMCSSDFHMGREAASKGRRYVEWDSHLFGSVERLERWWQLNDAR